MALPGPFPPAIPNLANLLPTHAGLSAALTAAQAQTAVTDGPVGAHKAPISLVEVVDNQTLRYAGFRDTAEMFSGSLLKVAAMLGAFGMRQWVNDVGALRPFFLASTFYSDLSRDFDTPIQNEAPQLLSLTGITTRHRVPTYSAVFAPPTATALGTCRVAFAPTFAQDLRDMIRISSDEAAARVIKALGYSYTIGLLTRLGLFDRDSKKGIWLAGHYDNGTTPAARIVPVENDTPSAQATTRLDMARLFALIIRGTELDSTSTSGDAIAAEMFALLSRGPGSLLSFLEADPMAGITGVGANYTVLATKIGVGGTNGNGIVDSEAVVVRHATQSRRFIVVYQDLRERADQAKAHNVMNTMIRTAIDNYMAFSVFG
jgi:hypothetical protein